MTHSLVNSQIAPLCSIISLTACTDISSSFPGSLHCDLLPPVILKAPHIECSG